MRMLAFDPGYGRLGYGVVDVMPGKTPSVVSCGVITTKAGLPATVRLHEIGGDVRALFEKYAPTHMAVEELFFAKNVTTGLKVAEVRGVLLFMAGERGVEVIEVKPIEAKVALTGYGKADKRQMQHMVKVVYGLADIPRPDDAADALAIAWCAVYKK
jgi:crossover junction endodeoxyribonuclease RuvC